MSDTSNGGYVRVNDEEDEDENEMGSEGGRRAGPPVDDAAQQDRSNGFAIYVNILKAMQQHQLRISVPRIVIVGYQSAGKSSILEQYVRFPATFIKSGTATRAPVQYTLRFSADHQQPQIQLEGRPCSQREVFIKLGQMMTEIGRNQGFSEESINVEVTSNAVRDIVLTDLPGLVPSSESADHSRLVQRITRRFVRDPQNHIVCMLDAQQDHAANPIIRDIAKLCTQAQKTYDMHPPRHDWRDKTIFLASKFDVQVANLQRAVDANNYFEGGKETKKYYISLKPMLEGSAPFDRTDKKYNEVQQHINNIEQIEMQMLDAWKDRIRRNEQAAMRENRPYDHLKPDWDSYLGIRNAKLAIDHLWFQAFKEQLPTILHELGRQELEARTNMEAYQLEKDSVDPQHIQRMYREYAISFREILRNLFKAHGEVLEKFPIAQYGRSYEEEREEYLVSPKYRHSEWQHLVNPMDILRCCGVEGEAYRRVKDYMDMKLQGGAQFRRQIKMWQMMVVMARFPEFSPSEILNYCAYLAHGDNTFLDAPKAVREMVLVGLRRAMLGPGAQWLSRQLLYIIDSKRTIVEDYLMKRDYQHLQNHRGFHELIRQKYDEVLESMVADAVETFRRLAKVREMYITHDYTARIDKLREAIPREIERVARETIEGADAGADGDPADGDPAEEAAGPTDDNGDENSDSDDDAHHIAAGVGDGVEAVAEGFADAADAVGVVAPVVAPGVAPFAAMVGGAARGVRGLFDRARDAMQGRSRPNNTVMMDLLRDGTTFMDPYRDASDPETLRHIQATARENYMGTMLQLLFDYENVLNSEVVIPVMENFSARIESAVTEAVSSTKLENQLEQYAGISAAEACARYNQEREKHAKISQLLEQVKHWQGALAENVASLDPSYMAAGPPPPMATPRGRSRVY